MNLRLGSPRLNSRYPRIPAPTVRVHSLRNTLQNVRRAPGYVVPFPELAINLHADVGGPVCHTVLSCSQGTP